jgi:hypothetical protein
MPRRRPSSLLGDAAQASFFDRREEAVPLGDFGQQVRTVLADMLTRARDERGMDRHAVAAEMNRIAGDAEGREVTKRMLDAYAAPSATEWRFPLEALPALYRATGDDALLRLTMTACGQKIVPEEAAALGELMVLQLQEKRIRDRKEALRKALPKGAMEWAQREIARGRK